MAYGQAILDRLRVEHPGDLFHLPDPDDEGDGIIVRMPSRQEWARFQAQLDDAKRVARALEQLVRDCLVHPEKAALEAMFDQRPGLAGSWGKAIGVQAGVDGELKAKKL